MNNEASILTKTTQPIAITVIIPVFNSEQYLRECIDSVYAQTFKNFEIIAIDDASTDNSASILKEYEKKHDNFLIVTNKENIGQGVSRNNAVKKAQGDYIQFLDSDDTLEDVTFELALARADTDNSDMVHYGWKHHESDSDDDIVRFTKRDPFSHLYMLEGDECDQLLRIAHYFAHHNLYRKGFLVDQEIRFGNERLYEDNLFVALLATKARRISLLQHPLYNLRKNQVSTTRKKYNDDRHSRAFVIAIQEIVDSVTPRNSKTHYYLGTYLIKKFYKYYTERVPRRFHPGFIRGFLQQMSRIELTSKDGKHATLNYCINNEIFTKKKHIRFFMLIQAGRVRFFFTKTLPNTLNNTGDQAYSTTVKRRGIEKVIIFTSREGYAGRIKELFLSLTTDPKLADYKIYFVSNSKDIPKIQRLEPGSARYFRKMAIAKVVIGTGWLPPGFKKREGQTIINMWNSYPIRRQFFDSVESRTMKVYRKHKTNKFRNRQKWDEFLVDSSHGHRLARTAYLFPEDNITHATFVSSILDHTKKDQQAAIKKIKQVHKIPNGKKIVFYSPSPRSYNFKKKAANKDYSYILNLKQLSEELGDDYVVMYDKKVVREHAKLAQNSIDVSGSYIHELILLADIFITDYRSEAVDAVLQGKPCYLYVNDWEIHEQDRGVYESMWSVLKPLAHSSVKDLAASMKQNRSQVATQKKLSTLIGRDSAKQSTAVAHIKTYL